MCNKNTLKSYRNLCGMYFKCIYYTFVMLKLQFIFILNNSILHVLHFVL